jgi:hypothetical protein
MPKPPTQPETLDRFRIHGDVAIEQLGIVLRELDKLGVTNIGHELVTDVLVYKQRTPRSAPAPAAAAEAKPVKKNGVGKGRAGTRHYAIRNKDFVLKYFKDREEVTAAEMTELFRKDGRHPSSAGSLLTQMAHDKYCKSMGDGVWKILAKGQQAAEKEAANG